LHRIAWYPTLFVLMLATATDLRWRRIPNWLVLPFLIEGVIVSGFMFGWHGIMQSIGGIAAAALLYGTLFRMGGIGMGDVKLCAAIGAWIGPHQLFFAAVLTGFAGGIMALAWAAWGGFVGDLLRGTGEILLSLKERKLRPHPNFVLNNPRARKMPYAPAIAVGTLISFLPR
jgi:prepilin peptidase CpaA